MRSTLTIILGFLILIGSTLWVADRIDSTSSAVLDNLDQIELLVASDQWDEASLKIQQTYDHWTKLHDWWSIFLNHGILNNIEISYKRLSQYVKYKEKSHSMAELNTLIFLLQEVPKSETLKLNNIL